jgi:hypothetical protein
MELAKLFQQSKGAPINVNGQELHAIIRRKSDGVKSIQIRRISARPIPVPGLRLQGSSTKFIVNSQQLGDVVLWADTSPDLVELDVVPGKKKGEIKIWNCWRDSQGLTQAWLRNAAMKVVEKPDSIEVFCNSGPSELDFVDLIVEIKFHLVKQGSP